MNKELDPSVVNSHNFETMNDKLYPNGGDAIVTVQTEVGASKRVARCLNRSPSLKQFVEDLNGNKQDVNRLVLNEGLCFNDQNQGRQQLHPEFSSLLRALTTTTCPILVLSVSISLVARLTGSQWSYLVKAISHLTLIRELNIVQAQSRSESDNENQTAQCEDKNDGQKEGKRKRTTDDEEEVIFLSETELACCEERLMTLLASLNPLEKLSIAVGMKIYDTCTSRDTVDHGRASPDVVVFGKQLLQFSVPLYQRLLKEIEIVIFDGNTRAENSSFFLPPTKYAYRGIDEQGSQIVCGQNNIAQYLRHFSLRNEEPTIPTPQSFVSGLEAILRSIATLPLLQTLRVENEIRVEDGETQLLPTIHSNALAILLSGSTEESCVSLYDAGLKHLFLSGMKVIDDEAIFYNIPPDTAAAVSFGWQYPSASRPFYAKANLLRVGLANNYTLVTLSLSKCKISSAVGMDVAVALEHRRSSCVLETLILNQCEVLPETNASANPSAVKMSMATIVEQIGLSLLHASTDTIYSHGHLALRHLNLSGLNLVDEDCTMICMFLENMSRSGCGLEHLDLSGNCIGDDGGMKLAAALMAVNGCEMNTCDDERVSRKHLASRSLKVLDLSRNKLGRLACLSLTVALKKSSSLETLSLGHNPMLEDCSWGVVGSSCSDGPSHYEDASVHEKEEGSDREPLPQCNWNSKVKSATRVANMTKVEVLRIILESIRSIPTLWQLDLSNTGIEDSHGDTFVSTLLSVSERPHRLSHLNLSCNQIGDDFVQLLADAIATTKKRLGEGFNSTGPWLKFLNLERNHKISAKGFRTLETLVEQHKLAPPILSDLRITGRYFVDGCWKGHEDLEKMIQHRRTVELGLSKSDSHRKRQSLLHEQNEQRIPPSLLSIPSSKS